MRLTTKFSAFVTLLTGLTIFVTLLGCSLSFYNAIQYKFSHRVQAVATAIDTHLVSNDFSALRPQITELMMSADIVRVDLLHGDKQVYTLARNGSYRPVGTSDLFRELSVPLIKHPGMSLRLSGSDGQLFPFVDDHRAAHGGDWLYHSYALSGGTLVTTATCRARIAGNPGYSYLKR
mgnify:CR=1 FL=1